MDQPYALHAKQFYGKGKIALMADCGGDPLGTPVILLHGGGQTRSSWGGAAGELMAIGCQVTALDLRGHGQSDWAADADYRLDAFCGDLRAIISRLRGPPILIGASLGGLVALTTTGESPVGLTKALILVDVTAQVDPDGRARIIGFMRARPDGFANLQEAADAIAEYLPHRPRPKDLGGLSRNLRRRDNGRWYWHWDPRLFESLEADVETSESRYTSAARSVDVPALLVRGANSELVRPGHMAHMLQAMPHAEYVDVPDATHMIAGDRNDVFNSVVIEFIKRRVLQHAFDAIEAGGAGCL